MVFVMGKTKKPYSRCPRESVKSGGFHFDGTNAPISRGFDCFGGLSEWGIRGPA